MTFRCQYCAVHSAVKRTLDGVFFEKTHFHRLQTFANRTLFLQFSRSPNRTNLCASANRSAGKIPIISIGVFSIFMRFAFLTEQIVVIASGIA